MVTLTVQIVGGRGGIPQAQQLRDYLGAPCQVSKRAKVKWGDGGRGANSGGAIEENPASSKDNGSMAMGTLVKYGKG